MSLLILVTGPNASGKTTTTHKALEPFQEDFRVVEVFADTDSYWKVGPQELKDKLLAEHRMNRVLQNGAPPVMVVEGTNRVAMAVLELRKTFEAEGRRMVCHVTRSSATVMRNAIKARCEKNNKKFRADYWSEKICGYEGRGRYANLMNKYGVTTRQYWDVDAEYSYAPGLIEALRTTIRQELGDADA